MHRDKPKEKQRLSPYGLSRNPLNKLQSSTHPRSHPHHRKEVRHGWTEHVTAKPVTSGRKYLRSYSQGSGRRKNVSSPLCYPG